MKITTEERERYIALLRAVADLVEEHGIALPDVEMMLSVPQVLIHSDTRVEVAAWQAALPGEWVEGGQGRHTRWLVQEKCEALLGAEVTIFLPQGL